MVKRVETLTGGASSIYGADAVSGVVNFILREGGDFDGVEMTAQSGMSSRSDANETYLSVATGFEFADGRGEMVLAVEGLTSEAVLESDREFAGPFQGNDINNTPLIAALNGINPNATRAYVTPTTNPISSAQGTFDLTSTDSFFATLLAVNGVRDGTGVPNIPGTNIPIAQVVDSPFNGTPRAFNPGTAPANVSQTFGIGDGLQSVRQTVLPPQDRYNINLNGSFAVNDSLSFFVESKYVYTKNNQVQGVDFNDAIPIAYDNPYLSPALQGQIADLQELGIIPPNPNDGSFYGFSAQRDSDDALVMPEDDVERETMRVVFGIEGELDIADGINYQLSYNYGRTEVTTNNINLRLEDRFYSAMDAVTDPATGDIVCASTLDPTRRAPVPATVFPYPQFADGVPFSEDGFMDFVSFTPGAGSPCVPFNPLGFNSTTQAYADFVYVDAIDTSEIEQNVILGSLAGTTASFFELPGGAIGWAAGFEYREEESTFTVNEFEGTGNTWDGSNGNQVTGLSGSFDVTEAFVEINAPLLADMPLIETLEVDAAYRYADYSTVGTNDAWSVGFRYSPGFGLTLRGTSAVAVRAPNIAELFSPQQPVFFDQQRDPCSIDNIDLNPNRAENCQQFVPAGYDINEFITAGIPGVSGGNPMLEPEEATTFTYGIVYEPTFVDGLRFIVDYYETEIEGAIDALAPERVAEACVDLPSTSNVFCPLIERDARGVITFHQSGQVNLGAFEVSGVDFGLDYMFALSGVGLNDLGSISFGLNGTHLIDFNEFQDPIDTSVFESRVGEFGYPEWIMNANVSWMFSDWTLSWAGRYEDTQLLSGLFNADFANGTLFADPSQTGDAWVHDFNFTFDVNEKISLYGGLNNAFDENPYLGSLSRPAGPRGRFGFLGVNLSL